MEIKHNHTLEAFIKETNFQRSNIPDIFQERVVLKLFKEEIIHYLGSISLFVLHLAKLPYLTMDKNLVASGLSSDLSSRSSRNFICVSFQGN